MRKKTSPDFPPKLFWNVSSLPGGGRHRTRSCSFRLHLEHANCPGIQTDICHMSPPHVKCHRHMSHFTDSLSLVAGRLELQEGWNCRKAAVAAGRLLWMQEGCCGCRKAAEPAGRLPLHCTGAFRHAPFLRNSGCWCCQPGVTFSSSAQEDGDSCRAAAGRGLHSNPAAG